MANVVKIKRSTTSGNVPASLVSGEIAVNEADGRLFYRNLSGSVTLLPLLVEAQNTANFPAVGAANTLYVSTDTGRCYHWVNNSVYVEIGPPAGPSQASGAYIYSLPPATTADLGGVISGTGTEIAANGTISVPPATSIALGGVKIGSNVSVAIDGTISVAAPVTTLAAAAITGLATVATSGSYVDLANKPTIPSAYTLPIATASVLGGVKQGSNTTIAADGTISVAAPVTTLPAGSITGLAAVGTSGSAADLSLGTLPVARLPLATVSAAGAVIIGSGLSVTSGTVSAAVTSVNTKTGAVALVATDVGAIASNTTGITGSAAVGNIVSLTAAQYTALGTKTASTLYIVTG